jgi:tagatose 6-phosphate kinase
MILCVNPNAAIDKTVTVERFQINAIYRPSFELALPGGKGCNVARAAQALGEQAVVAGWAGGHAGRFIVDGLRAEGIGAAFVRTKEESRTCLSIHDPVLGTMTEIYEKGRLVSEKEVRAFYDLYRKWLPRAAVVALSGSLPPGVPADFYAELIRLARREGIPAILDSSGEALRVGWEIGKPAMLKCNRAELSDLAGRSLAELDDLLETIRGLGALWNAMVVVTLGAAGAAACEPVAEYPAGARHAARTWLAQPPRVEAASAVGAGDAVLAGIACGMVNGQPFQDALRLGIAAGAANTLMLGAGCLRKEDVDILLDQVRVAEVP